MPAPEQRLGFSRARRITKTTDIERLLRSGRRVRARLFDVRRLDSESAQARVAIVVPKFEFNAARRNTLKRRVRELMRTRLLPKSAPCDLLVRARREAYDASFGQLRDEIDHLAESLA